MGINGALPADSAVSIGAAGKLQLGAGIGLATMSSLSIAAGGILDVENNHIILSYGAIDPASTIYALLQSGYNGGSWNGPGIDSSTAALPANNTRYGLGYADGADGIVTGLSSGQIEIKYTLLGDVDLDGSVTGSDFTILASNLGKEVNGWDQGDFQYTGAVTGSDFTALAQNLGKSASGADLVLPASDYAAIDAFAAENGLMADVPEPASAGFLLAAGLGFMARRRRTA